ncbi:hypothetical protein D3C76_935800 [compost metagenome]
MLNKIDVLWDDLAGDSFVQNAIRRIQETTARQLGIRSEEVLPLSAKQALLAKVRNDDELLERSQIGALEGLLCERIVTQKERLIEDNVASQVMALLQNSLHVLNLRLEKVREQQSLLDNHQQDNGQMLFELTARTKEDHAQHHRRLLGLKTNQRLLKRQGDMLRNAARSERLDEHLARLRRELTGSWTTLGINQSILHFFRAVEYDLRSLEHEADMANKMVSAIYRRHNDENPLHGVEPPQFNVQRYLREIRQLRAKADQFRRHPKTLLTEQRQLGKRFFDTLVQEVIGMHQRLRLEVAQWASDALMPLMQHTLEHKQLLETHMLRLKALAQETQLTRQRGQQLEHYTEELEQQIAQANEMLRTFRLPSPMQRMGKVVNLPLAPRRQSGGESA